MGRRVEFCWSVGQWRAFLRGQSLLFSRESSGLRAALATRGAVFYFRFRSIAHTIFLFHCLDRGFTLTGLAPMRSKRSGDLERRRIRVAVGKEHIFLRSNRFRNFRWSASCRTAMRASAGVHPGASPIGATAEKLVNRSNKRLLVEKFRRGFRAIFFFGRWGLRHVCL